ncbi:MAG: GGDEF domain-containing protein [Spirochaetales bacterium]|nr:GGDEF domain-containing protein [Spirochaetales bacterium]
MVEIQLLKKASLFSALMDEDLDYIKTRVVEKIFHQGEVVFHRGGAAIHFYIVKSGEIGVTQVVDDNKKMDLARYVTGDSFGEFDFITNSLYDVEACALKKSSLILFPAFPHTFDSLTNEKPDIMARLYFHSLFILSSRLRAVHTLIAENTTWIKYLQEQLYTDQLTGLFTKLYLEREISRLLATPVAFIVIKPDRFKQLNDIFGHKAGDAVLVRIASAIQNKIREEDTGWAVRLRGNEVVLILNRTKTKMALEIARSLAVLFLSIGPGRIYTAGEKADPEKKQVFRLTATIAIGICRHTKQNWKKVLTDTYNLMNLIWMKGGNEICVLGSPGMDIPDNPGVKKKEKDKDHL